MATAAARPLTGEQTKVASCVRWSFPQVRLHLDGWRTLLVSLKRAATQRVNGALGAAGESPA